MLIEWANWVRSLRPDELVVVLGVLLLVDAPRYAYSAVLMAVWDLLKGIWRLDVPYHRSESFDYCPDVCVIIAGYNEGETIAKTMMSVWNRYPKIELVVIDDGSTDNMYEEARKCAAGRDGITVVRREERGGNRLR
ncbi:MAG: glycosyltransferase [Planctomycetaceae bacterium]